MIVCGTSAAERVNQKVKQGKSLAELGAKVLWKVVINLCAWGY